MHSSRRSIAHMCVYPHRWGSGIWLVGRMRLWFNIGTLYLTWPHPPIRAALLWCVQHFGGRMRPRFWFVLVMLFWLDSLIYFPFCLVSIDEKLLFSLWHSNFGRNSKWSQQHHRAALYSFHPSFPKGGWEIRWFGWCSCLEMGSARCVYAMLRIWHLSWCMFLFGNWKSFVWK